MTNKEEKNIQNKTIGYSWIGTAVRLAAGLQENQLDHLASTYCILHWSNLPIYHLPMLVRSKLHDLWVCTILHYPWVCTIITVSLARPLGLHYNLA